LVEVVATAYYGEAGRGKREGLQPIIDIAERAHPGVIELARTTDGPGFTVRLAERPFPKRFEAELRDVVTSALNGGSTLPPSRVPLPSLFTRIIHAIRKAFSA
jgi:hypothetical protein